MGVRCPRRIGRDGCHLGAGVGQSQRGRGFFFFVPQLEFTYEMTATAGGKAYLAKYYTEDVLSRVFGTHPWFLGAKHLALPFAAALAALVYLVGTAARMLRRPTDCPLLWCTLSTSAQMLVASTIWVVQEARYNPALLIDFSSYPLIFPAFLVVAMSFARVFGPSRFSPVSHVLVAAAAGFALLRGNWLQMVVGPWVLPSWPAAAPFLLYGFALLGIIPLSPRYVDSLRGPRLSSRPCDWERVIDWTMAWRRGWAVR